MLADKFYPLAVEEILYFYTANEKVTAYTSDGKQHPVDRTLDALGEQLDERLFFRAIELQDRRVHESRISRQASFPC